MRQRERGGGLPSELLKHASAGVGDLLGRVGVDVVAGLLGSHAEGCERVC